MKRQRRDKQRKESRCECPQSPQCELEKMQEKEVQTEGGSRGASAEFQSSRPGSESAKRPLGVMKGFREAPDINHLQLPGTSPSAREHLRLLLN